MKVWYGSDLHVEFPGNSDLEVGVEDADLAVLAGDIGEGVAGIEWAAATFDIPIIYVSGNHEYYHREFQEHTQAMRERAAELGVHFLEKDTLEVAGFRFAGCTLWTDYAVLDDVAAGMETALKVMADHRLIRSRDRLFQPGDALGLHRESVAWLESLEAIDVVVTHHSPSLLGIGTRHPLNQYTPAFASGLDELINALKPQAWIFGHTHDSVRAMHPGGTALLSNQHGYPDETWSETGWVARSSFELS